MNIKKIIITSLIAIISLIIAIFINSKKRSKNIDIRQVPITSTMKIEKFKLQQLLKNNQNKLILKANNGELFKDQNIAKCNKSKLSFIKNDKKIATLKALKTIFYLKESKVEMFGGIKSKILNNSTDNSSIY